MDIHRGSHRWVAAAPSSASRGGRATRTDESLEREKGAGSDGPAEQQESEIAAAREAADGRAQNAALVSQHQEELSQARESEAQALKPSSSSRSWHSQQA